MAPSFHRALFALLLVAGPARALDLVAPRDGGVVLGDRVTLEVADASRAPDEVKVDGVAVAATWTRLPWARRWAATVPLGVAASHVVEVRLGGDRASARVTDGASTLAVAERVAAHIVQATPPASLDWQWGPAVLLDSLHRYAKVSPDRARWVAAVASHQQRWLGKLPSIDRPDRCASALMALSLSTDENDARFLPSAAVVADYLRREPRNALGALDHLGARSPQRFWVNVSLVLRPWARSIWVDSLMMYALFAARYGTTTKDLALRDFGLAQARIFASEMQDPTTGLFVHAWDVTKDRPLGAVWGRGNGWAATTVADLLDVCPPGHPERPHLERILRAHAAGLLAARPASGLWDTVIDGRGPMYAETSGSALIAYGLAKGARLGVLPPAARQAARETFRTITSRLKPKSTGLSVTGTSIATNATPRWVYRLMPRQDDVAWGTGSYLRLAAELSGESWRGGGGIVSGLPGTP